MYTNAPTPELFRAAELRRRENLMFAAGQRRYTLLAKRSGSLGQLRNRLGTMLIAVGARMTTTPTADTQQATAG